MNGLYDIGVCRWCQSMHQTVDQCDSVPPLRHILFRVTCECGACGPWRGMAGGQTGVQHAVNAWNRIMLTPPNHAEDATGENNAR